MSLKMPNPTRFAGDAILFSSLKSNKAALQESVIAEEIKIDETVRADILDDAVFWKNVNIAEKLLKPIAKGITILEGNSPNLSLVPRLIMDIKQELITTLESASFNSSIYNTILGHLKKRIDFCCKDIHKTAYFLDPRFRGESLSDEECLNCIKITQQISNNLNINENVVANAAMNKSNTLW